MSGENLKRKIILPPVVIPCNVSEEINSPHEGGREGLTYDDVDREITKTKKSKLKLPKIVVPDFSPGTSPNSKLSSPGVSPNVKTPKYSSVFEDQVESCNLKVGEEQNHNKLNVKKRRRRNLSDISSIEVM